MEIRDYRPAADRPKPLSLVIVNVLNSMAQIGWVIFGFGTALFWTYVVRADYSSVTYRGPWTQASGVVTGVEKTEEKEAKRPVYANRFVFSIAGNEFSGVSYSTGRTVERGQRVIVEYVAADPRQSRIAGMRRKLFSPSIAFLTAIPLIGAVIAFRAMKRGWRATGLGGRNAAGPAAALRALIIPIIVIAANVLAVVARTKPR